MYFWNLCGGSTPSASLAYLPCVEKVPNFVLRNLMGVVSAHLDTTNDRHLWVGDAGIFTILLQKLLPPWVFGTRVKGKASTNNRTPKHLSTMCNSGGRIIGRWKAYVDAHKNTGQPTTAPLSIGVLCNGST